MAELDNLKNESKHGGVRPNAGRPKGTENEDVKRRRIAKKAFVERVISDHESLFNAQKAIAVGSRHILFMVETTKDGKRLPAVEVTTPSIIMQYLDNELNNDGDKEYYFMTQERPDNKAIDSLLNRAFGKPEEKLDITSDNKPIPILGGVVHMPSDDDEPANE